jgi:hypothetical protein
MYKRLPEIPAKFEPFMELLEAAEDEPLSDREKEVCLERLEAVRLMTSLTGNGVPHESPEVQKLSKKIQEPFLNEYGLFAPFTDRHFAWTLDQIMRQRLFKNEAELEEAKEQTQIYFRDGKPFTCRRWMLMRIDAAKAATLRKMRMLS